MKLGDVVRKERELRGLGAEETASRMGIPIEQYLELEGGATPAEAWGPRLAKIAVQLETPTARLLAESGRSADAGPGRAGPLISHHRKRKTKKVADMAEAVGVSEDEYRDIEAGRSPIETWGPILLAFAEVIEQPVFNLFYPRGLHFQELDDYP